MTAPLRTTAGQLISTILRHDAKVTTYKIALLRAINDLVLAFPDLDRDQHAVAVPLRVLADSWIAYYWPFVDPSAPIWQGPRVAGQTKADMSFRPALTTLRQEWERIVGSAAPADGFFLINDLRVARKRLSYPSALLAAYDAAMRPIITALQQPIKYAGPKGRHWSVFQKPIRFAAIGTPVTPVPGTCPDDLCLLLPPDLWAMFREVSLWVEALCIHEWCRFSEQLTQVDRGLIYRLLTDRPGNRRPLDWERNQIDILLLEGQAFCCPWTARPITTPGSYDVDHLIPVSAYPINELWNLVPSDRQFNQHTKRDRLPTWQRLVAAEGRLARVYQQYATTPDLAHALGEDVATRFAITPDPARIASVTIAYIDQIATLRNLTRF
jgi:hypothetical protein